jgi:hypothetical protein
VDGITGTEDQERDEERIAELLVEVQRLTALVRTVDLFGTGFVWTDRATGKQHMLHPADVAVILRADQGTEIEKIKESAYRAGREDLLRSGSCPECTAGDPHNEPDVPHIHLTPYGYLLYAADHERPGFIEEIRAVERRAGREDAARAQKQDRIDEQWSVWLTMPGGITVVTLADEQDDEPLNALGDVRRYDSDEEWARDYAANPPEGTLKAQVRRRTRTHWSAWQPVDQSGVQPTEEQRARDEDQERGEEQEHG